MSLRCREGPFVVVVVPLRDSERLLKTALREQIVVAAVHSWVSRSLYASLHSSYRGYNGVTEGRKRSRG